MPLTALLIAQCLGAVLLAGVLGMYWREYRQSYLGWWACSFAALALYVLAQLAAYQMRGAGFVANDAPMFAAAFIYTSLGFLQLIALLVGLMLLLRPRWTPRRSRIWIALASLLLGVLVTLPYAGEPDGNLSRLFLRTGLRYLLTGIALCVAGATILLARAPQHGGRWLVATGLLLYGVLLAVMGTMSVPLLPTSGSRALGELARLQPVAELLAYQVIGLGLVIWLLDIERRRAQRADLRLRTLSRLDPLTGLANDAGLRQSLHQHFARNPGQDVVLALVGLDNFRLVNQALGMHGGDAALAALGKRLAARADDGLEIGRLAGDQFVVFTCDDAGAMPRIRALQQLIATRLPVGSQSLGLASSIGWSRLRSPSAWHSVLREAEIALHTAKEQGGGQALGFSLELRARMLDWVSFGDELEQAFASDAFVIYLQPIIRCADGSVSGFEALARWQHPRRGLLDPGAFLPQLHTLRMMPRFDTLIFERTIALLGRCDPAVAPRISVNLSAESVGRPNLVGEITTMLKRHAVDPGRLQVEVSESAAMRSLDAGLELLQQLVDLGVMVAIDDFGTGYSSLTYLTSLPADTIKFDRGFIRSLGEGGHERDVLEALVPLCHRLGRSVVAEGVEDEAQFGLVRALGFDAVQGYLFARPAPAEDALASWSGAASRPPSAVAPTAGSAHPSQA